MAALPEEVDVVVIGAGLSGLFAAKTLLNRVPELRVVVLEGKDRVGGRTLTVDVTNKRGESEPIDLGGQWVSREQKHVVELMKELGVEHYDQQITGKKVMQVRDNKVRTYTDDIPNIGTIYGLLELQWFLWKCENLAKKVPIDDPYSSELARELDSYTVEAYMKKFVRTKATLDTVDAAIKTVLGTDASRVSLLFFLAYANSAGGLMKLLLAKDGAAQEYKLKGGAQQLSTKLAENVGWERVFLNKPVKSISRADGTPLVTLEDGKEIRCRYAISAIPPNMVRSLKVDPPLPTSHQLLLESMPMGHLIKFFVIYDRNYWRQKGYSGEVVTSGGPYANPECECGPISIVMDATTTKNTPALVGFIAGKQATEWSMKSREERREAVTESLSKLFNGDWARHPVDYIEKDWREEPYNGGCPVCYGVPGITYSFYTLRRPFHNVMFAGTETATEWTGYLSGAIQAGERSALEVVKRIKPLALKTKDFEILSKAQKKGGYPYVKQLPINGKSWQSTVGRLSSVALLAFLAYRYKSNISSTFGKLTSICANFFKKPS